MGKTNNPAGRPKGSKNKGVTGLSFAARMKVLQKIILNTSSTNPEILQAIKLMTYMLSDKVQVMSANVVPTIIKFEDNKDKKTIIEKTEENSKEIVQETQNITENIDNKDAVITIQTVEKPIEKPVEEIKEQENPIKEEKSDCIVTEFIIKEQNSDKLSDENDEDI